MALPEPVAVTIQVTQVLEELEIPYLIGGSLASSVHGLIRTTQDADLLVDIRQDHLPLFKKLIEPIFYFDEQAASAAIVQHGSFNLLHRSSFFRVDIFVARDRAFDKAQILRAKREVLSVDPLVEAKIATAEDSLLAKLEWYKLGNESSERQWQDILGVLKVQSDRLNNDYLEKWATELEVADLLVRAKKEISSP